MSAGLSDVFYLRPMDPPLTPAATLEMGRQADGCFGLHGVAWMQSFLATDGRRMLCWYRAPDAESARIALRELGAELRGVWPGRVLGNVEPRDSSLSKVNVIAELLPAGAIGKEALLDRLHGVTADFAEIACAFLSNRRDRLVCLLSGDNADAIGQALAADGFGAARAWPCRVVTPPGD
ncbi:MAG TPA: hypothetical protein VF200_09460 [Woeseiaceae bacterium]